MHDQSLGVYQCYWRKALYLIKTRLKIGKINNTLPLEKKKKKRQKTLEYFPSVTSRITTKNKLSRLSVVLVFRAGLMLKMLSIYLTLSSKGPWIVKKFRRKKESSVAIHSTNTNRDFSCLRKMQLRRLLGYSFKM